jgi:hypothetical protein
VRQDGVYYNELETRYVVYVQQYLRVEFHWI